QLTTSVHGQIPAIIHLGLFHEIALHDGLISVEQENLTLGGAEILYSTFNPFDQETFYKDELVGVGIVADTHTVLATQEQIDHLREEGIDFEALEVELEENGDNVIFVIKHKDVAHLIDPNYAEIERKVAETHSEEADDAMLAMLNIREIIRVIGDANIAMIVPPEDKSPHIVLIDRTIIVPFMLPQIEDDQEAETIIYIVISELFMDNSLLSILINYLRRLMGDLWDIAEAKIEEYKVSEGFTDTDALSGYELKPIRISIEVEPLQPQMVSFQPAVARTLDSAVSTDTVGAVFYAITTTGDTDAAQLSELKLTRGVPEATDEDAAWRSFYDKKVADKDMRYVEQLAQRFVLDQRQEWQQFKQDRMEDAAWSIVFEMMNDVDTSKSSSEDIKSAPKTLTIPARTVEHDVFNGTEVLVEERGGYIALSLPDLTINELVDTPGVSGDVFQIGKSIDVPLTLIDVDQDHSQTAEVYILEDKWVSHKTLWDLLMELLQRLLGGLWDNIFEGVQNETAGEPPHEKYAKLIAQRMEEYELRLANISTVIEVAEEETQAAVFYATTNTGDTTQGGGDTAMLARTLELTKGLPETFESDAEQTAAWRNFYDKKVAEGDRRYIEQLAQRFI
ncbi:MAG: hypothetical protein K8I00_06275, partial [Candidatus Omnitrophica bacterium]|nr:hypothetical protein [Candidatus Omnitrophota bacterium]